MKCRCLRIISRTYRNGHAQLAPWRCPHSSNSQGYCRRFISRHSALTNLMNTMRHWNLSSQKTWRKWKQSSQQDRSRDIQIWLYGAFYSHHGLVCFDIDGLLSQKQLGVEFFISCWGRKRNYEGRTNGFSEEYGGMESVTQALISF